MSKNIYNKTPAKPHLRGGKDKNNLPSEVSMKQDEELVVLALENPGDFLYLMKRYEKKLLRYIMRITNVGPEESEDILQDVFIKVYRNLNDFDPELKFSSWIYRIARNQAISNFRKNQARPEGTSLELSDELVNRLASNLNLEKKLDIKLLGQSITKILTKMEKKYREVLILKFLEEKDYKEISDILKKPMGTVATLINRAKKKFREIIINNNIKI